MSDLDALLKQLVTRAEVSAVVAAISVGGVVVEQAAASALATLGGDPQSWRFDLASLTKPVTATVALKLAGTGRLSLEAPIHTLLPELPALVSRRPLADLLAHRSGLAAWTPISERGWNLEVLLAQVGEAGLAAAPRPTYSDLGFLALGVALERLDGVPLADLVRREVALPLGLEGLTGPPGGRPQVVPCSLDRSREVELAAAQGLTLADCSAPGLGAAQDGNARALGGVCGHAGLFGRVGDLLAFAEAWRRPGELLEPELVRWALSTPARGRFLRGWWRRRVRGAAGRALGPRAFGHVGFTGGSLWIDPDLELVAVLLAHRPAANVDLTPARRRFHHLAVELARGRWR